MIGIIGGAGVAATNKLNELIEIDLTKNGAFRDFHHPEIIIWQATQVPSRSMYLEGNGDSFINEYVKIASSLKSLGCRKICMCCNTAHYAINEISNKSHVDFIDLIKEVVLEAKNTNLNKIGVIASNGCLQGKVYEKYFKEYYPKATIIYPNKEEQKLVTLGICNIKNKYRFLSDDAQINNIHQRPRKIFSNVVNALKKRGAEIVIIGCTDIRVDYFEVNNIDSLEVLKKAIIKEVNEKRY
ncbi:aspartate/glutamate racemase family protein [Campylobacter volucris]|uniref:aspartate/glutamate racemase family protein n=1 Tax=Campylobacter volucris TaxID=1031542 RepID=UPI00189EC97F|nr:amino acid racemase [Campylobacter volucris]MBF7045961.1 aspartate/glutamate racemase family protein [Campylobacter volucris]